MSILRNRFGSTLFGAVFTLTCVAPALADDSEIYVNNSTGANAVRPNIMFIVDTSISMNEDDVENERLTYDKDMTYAVTSNCSDDRLFFQGPGDPIPTCSSTNYITSKDAYNQCDKLRKATVIKDSAISGRWTGKVAMYDTDKQAWDKLVAMKDAQIECAVDSGVHGKTGPEVTTKKYARNNDKNKLWSNDPATAIDWSQQKTYTFYSANWLNWREYTDPIKHADRLVKHTRLQAVTQSVIDMAASIDGVNLGLMRYSKTNQGGYVTEPVIDIDLGRSNIINTVNGYGSGDSYTPLAETLWEAYQYYTGGTVDYGANSSPGKSIKTSRNGGKDNSTNYLSPIIGQCQKSFVIYLTDGLPTRDVDANGMDRIGNLIKGTCDGPQVGTKNESLDDGLCLDDLAGYMNTHDLNSTLAGPQTVQTFTIGFGADIKDNKLLGNVASEGGGEAYEASGTDDLQRVLTDISSKVLDVSTTFSTASVGVSAFNRAQTRDELYYALFAPKETVRWEGNLKKFKLDVDPTDDTKLIVTSQAGGDAVDHTTGKFKDTSRSYWSAKPDGNEVTAGGAANKLPDPDTRKILTFIGANPAGTPTDLVAITKDNDTVVTNAMLNVASGTPTRADLLEFILAGESKRMGDPLHSQPAVVTYDGDETTPKDVVYVATNDGYLHAINPDDASGVEKWAFIPRDLLGRLRSLYINEGGADRTYGLDGDIQIVRLDRNGNGKIESPDDRVWLFVGMRRGGKYLYALDVTDPDKPKMMWTDGADDPNSLGYTILPGLGETWSPPVIARADINGAVQNSQKLVLIFGGGYDSAQEDGKQIDDSMGNRVFMVDAKTGKLLWYAANNTTHTGADESKLTVIADMKNSIPSGITTIDTNNDLFVDRMYVGDMGGRVFRFDVFNKKTAKELVTGGVIAELGQGQVKSPAVPNPVETRRFYNPPDVALIERRGEDPYYNIAIGSGYRGHPLSKATNDRFYSIRDKAPFAKFPMTYYNDATRKRIQDGDLKEVSLTNPLASEVSPTEPGWRLLFGMTGEKVLAQSTTADDTILFSTYQPQEPSAADPCRPRSRNRAYAVSVDNGRPTINLNNSGSSKDTITNDDLFQDVPMDGILGKINVGVLRGKLANKLKGNKKPPTVCLAGMNILGSCVQVDDSVRTYWRKDVDQGN